MVDDTSATDGVDGSDADTGRTYPEHLLEQGRQRGLSKTDRRYLASGGATVDDEGTEVNTRTRIRKRVRESIVDFWLLTEYLDEHDRDLIFRESNDDWDNWELQIGLKSAMQFFYTALDETDLADFDTVLTSGIHDAERDKHENPVLVDVDFDVDVDEQFRVQEAYDKFQRGVPLDPMEIGALLITGWVYEPEAVKKLAHHARSNGFIEHSIAPLLGAQLAEISGEETPIGSFRYTLAHLPEVEASGASGDQFRDLPSRSDYEYLEEERWFHESEIEQTHPEEDLLDEDLAEELADAEVLTDDTDGASSDESDDPDAALRRLSAGLDEPITVGDDVVYEDGDRHILDGDDAGIPDEDGADRDGAESDRSDADADAASDGGE